MKKSFNFNSILSDLNFKVNKGEIIHISGSNGVGKTTLLKIIAGILSPEFGEVSIFKKICYQKIAKKKAYSLLGAPTYDIPSLYGI